MKSPLVILLAEDNPGDVFLVREALREHRLEFELFVAENGDKVAALLERVGKSVPQPDVLLLDLNLPGIEGKQLFQQVRAHPLCANVPIVVVTSSDSPKDRAWTSEFQVSHYFRKPSDFEEFLSLGAVVREVTGK
jgi:chemotaxis family two-component system response regulator Rcp1